LKTSPLADARGSDCPVYDDDGPYLCAATVRERRPAIFDDR